MIFRTCISALLVTVIFGCHSSTVRQEKHVKPYQEQHRPQFHFSPPQKWMNDPNGMVYIDGTYHLFYQHYPDSAVWGPMHWGHATSQDLIHWENKPIAIYPDELGYIFSGSAVFDKNNSSGLGTVENPPLVAIFTYHDPVGEKEGRLDFQTQGIAFSLDKGETWEKYEKNPVLHNPGIRDFRDPKVRWHPETDQWIMALAVQDHIRFYSSPNLIDWKLESEFGKTQGAHGGVWECPDLFPLAVNDSEVQKYVLLVSINPGGPNKGSATQYFIGDFDGHTFTPDTDKILWMDYGPDNYAGVTFGNSGARTILIGWMSNWDYANIVPTYTWRSAMTLPRELKLATLDGDIFLKSVPVKEYEDFRIEKYLANSLTINGSVNLSELVNRSDSTFELSFETSSAQAFTINLMNNEDQKLEIGYLPDENIYYIDRKMAGKTDFKTTFGDRIIAQRKSVGDKLFIQVIVDVSSVEVFAVHGLTLMTGIFFADKAFNSVLIEAENSSIENLKYYEISSIW